MRKLIVLASWILLLSGIITSAAPVTTVSANFDEMHFLRSTPAMRLVNATEKGDLQTLESDAWDWSSKYMDMVSLYAVFSAFCITAVSEMGDRSFIVATLMALRHGRGMVFLGTVIALTSQSFISSGVGFLIQQLPSNIAQRIRAHVIVPWLVAGLLLLFSVAQLREGLCFSDGEPVAQQFQPEYFDKELEVGQPEVSDDESDGQVEGSMADNVVVNEGRRASVLERVQQLNEIKSVSMLRETPVKAGIKEKESSSESLYLTSSFDALQANHNIVGTGEKNVTPKEVDENFYSALLSSSQKDGNSQKNEQICESTDHADGNKLKLDCHTSAASTASKGDELNKQPSSHYERNSLLSPLLSHSSRISDCLEKRRGTSHNLDTRDAQGCRARFESDHSPYRRKRGFLEPQSLIEKFNSKILHPLAPQHDEVVAKASKRLEKVSSKVWENGPDGWQKNLKVFWQAFCVVFAAEIGDTSMIVTASLAAANSPVAVFIGASMANIIVNGVGILAGSIGQAYISERHANFLAAGIFFLCSFCTAVDAFEKMRS